MSGAIRLVPRKKLHDDSRWDTCQSDCRLTTHCYVGDRAVATHDLYILDHHAGAFCSTCAKQMVGCLGEILPDAERVLTAA